MPARGEETSDACPTDDTVALFLSGGLPERDEAGFRVHVDQCDLCRGLLAEAGRDMSQTLGTTRVTPLEAPGTTPVRAAIGDVIGDKYRIDAVLGAGGMGTVYRGWHLGLSRTVAIKMMHPELLTDSLARRFAREARAAASITSEHAVRIVDIDRTPNGTPYIVMEHLEGHDLHEVLMSGGPLHWERAVRYVLEAADAIGEAHARGIIHRDLKPHNLFLTHADVVKVLDFGLAKTMPHSLARGSSAETKTTGLVGSPQYMAPEQIRAARTVDARTDVYGLGATLYQLLSGVPPFLGLNLYVLCARILNEPPAPLARARKDVPPPIEAVVLRCLEKLPGSRYGTVEELAEALRDAASAASAERQRREPLDGPATTVAPPMTSLAGTLREQELMTARELPMITRQEVIPATLAQPSAPAPSTDPEPERTPRMIEHGEAPPRTVRIPRTSK